MRYYVISMFHCLKLVRIHALSILNYCRIFDILCQKLNIQAWNDYVTWSKLLHSMQDSHWSYNWIPRVWLVLQLFLWCAVTHHDTVPSMTGGAILMTEIFSLAPQMRLPRYLIVVLVEFSMASSCWFDITLSHCYVW